MARDSALQVRAARSGESVFSIYSWCRPTLSFGRNQPARDRYDLEKIRDAGMDIVRRPTGGRAILHHREVTYSVTAPSDTSSLRETYSRIHGILQMGLTRLGVPVETAGISQRAPAPGMRPCFDTPTRGELVSQGAKLVGSAQWRDCIRTVADILMGRFEMEDIMAAPGLDNLHIIEAGPIPANPSELLSTEAMTTFLREVSAEYDIVLIDTPPVLPVTDSAIAAVE